MLWLKDGYAAFLFLFEHACLVKESGEGQDDVTSSMDVKWWDSMAYAVSIGSGYSRFTVRFPDAVAALEKAQDEVDHGAENVTVTISATQERLAVDEFRTLLEKGLLKDPS